MATEESGLKVSENGQGVGHAAPVNKRPTLPSSFFKFPTRSRLKVIQQYISSFQYKQSPQTSFNSHKSRPLVRIMDTAKTMIHNPQPIKCVEAVFLALFLTVHQHIVLLVKYNNKYGAFGISRQHNLRNKEFEFESVSSIVDQYRKAYEEYEHKVTRIRVGLPVEHNIESFNFVCWRHLSLDPSLVSWEQCSEALERHMIHAKRLWERWLSDGQRENKADLFLKNLDTNPALAFNKSSLRKKISNCSLPSSTAVKAVTRRQESDKQEPDFKLVKGRHALQEMPAMGNTVSQFFARKIATSEVKALPPLLRRNSPRDLPKSTCSQCQSLRKEATPISVTQQKKIALRCNSMELFSGSWRSLGGLQTDNKKPKTKHDKKADLQRAQGSVRKPELLNFSTKPSRKSLRKKAEALLVRGPVV